jgi:serine/threonine-protein kinase SRK2
MTLPYMFQPVAVAIAGAPVLMPFLCRCPSLPATCPTIPVAGRDLKLDNTILDSRDPPRLKLCDFGFAKGWGADSNMDTMRIGTPEYMGPELISSR